MLRGALFVIRLLQRSQEQENPSALRRQVELALARKGHSIEDAITAEGRPAVHPDHKADHEDGGSDAFVHITAVERAGMATLQKDQRVSYELEQDRRGKMSAVNLQSA